MVLLIMLEMNITLSMKTGTHLSLNITFTIYPRPPPVGRVETITFVFTKTLMRPFVVRLMSSRWQKPFKPLTFWIEGPFFMFKSLTFLMAFLKTLVLCFWLLWTFFINKQIKV